MSFQKNIIAPRAAVIEKIAQEKLRITLEQRNRDSLDFHDLSVWAIKDALELAYMAGVAAVQS